MAVATDFLLQPAPEVKPQASAAKAPDNNARPSNDEASSFANVYARERQVKAAERHDAGAKAARDKRDAADAPAAAPASDEPAVAESGKTLPDETADAVADEDKSPEQVVDPLLLLAMAGQAPAEEVASPQISDGAADVAPADLLAALPSVGTTPGGLTEASLDPQVDLLNSADAVSVMLTGGKGATSTQQPLSPGALAAEKALDPTTTDASTDLAEALATLTDQASSDSAGEGEGDAALAQALDVLPTANEERTDVRDDAFASKLNALTQAIGQQGVAAARVPLVPGQPVAMNQNGWSEAVVDRVMWLSSQNLKSAEIQLDPADLGRLDVRIQMGQDQTQITFASANPNVRDQLEGQMHRLRDMFTQQGMGGQLDVNVSNQSFAQQGQQGGESRRGGSAAGLSTTGSDDEVLAGVSEIRQGATSAPRGLVDYYA
jgi:flagellar hook-length control protein FliK